MNQLFQNIGILTPAAIVSGAVYLMHLYGKMISDQNPYTDDRKVEVEFMGLFFLLYFIGLPAVIGIGIATAIEHWRDSLASVMAGVPAFTVLGVMYLYLSLKYVYASKRYQGLPAEIKFEQVEQILPKDREVMERTAKGITAPPSRVALFYIVVGIFVVGTFEHLHGNIFWFYGFLILAFFLTTLVATNHSLLQYRRYKGNIHLVDGETLQDHSILHVENSYVRTKDDDFVYLINRDQIQRIEIDLGQFPKKESKPSKLWQLPRWAQLLDGRFQKSPDQPQPVKGTKNL